MSTNDPINPDHYRTGKVECVDALEAATAGKTGIEAVCTANVIKYLYRYEAKNGLQDVLKAKWYLDKLVDVLSSQEASGKAPDELAVEASVPDWNDAPEWAQWVAQDSGGDWFWYEKEPEKANFTWYSEVDTEAIFSVNGPKNPNWRNTLEQRPINDGWIQWHGGECPVDISTVVQVSFKGKDGIEKIFCPAGELRWSRRGFGDIIAYRVIK